MNPKNVLITGGGSGIGAATAVALAQAGHQVIISGRNLEKLNSLIEQSGQSMAAVASDVSDRESAQSLVQTATEQMGQIDIVINAAGVNFPKRTIDELDPTDWDQLLAINATGTFNIVHTVLPQMRERRDGLIINISSISGIRAYPLGGIGYNASKFAASALGIAVGDEVKDEGIRVTNIYPGEVNTPILEQRKAPPPESHRQQILQPDDVAAAVMMIVNLPPRARVAELTILPTTQSFI